MALFSAAPFRKPHGCDRNPPSRPRLREVRLLRRHLLEECAGGRRGRAARSDVVRGAGVSRGRRRQVDHANVVRDRPHRVVRALTVHLSGVGPALLEGHVFRRSRIRDGFGIAQCLLRVGDHGLCVLCHRVSVQGREADCDEGQSLHHSYSSSTARHKTTRFSRSASPGCASRMRIVTVARRSIRLPRNGFDAHLRRRRVNHRTKCGFGAMMAVEGANHRIISVIECLSMSFPEWPSFRWYDARLAARRWLPPGICRPLDRAGWRACFTVKEGRRSSHAHRRRSEER